MTDVEVSAFESRGVHVLLVYSLVTIFRDTRGERIFAETSTIFFAQGVKR